MQTSLCWGFGVLKNYRSYGEKKIVVSVTIKCCHAWLLGDLDYFMMYFSQGHADRWMLTTSCVKWSVTSELAFRICTNATDCKVLDHKTEL